MGKVRQLKDVSVDKSKKGDNADRWQDDNSNR